MRLSQLLFGNATSQSLLASSLALVLTALPACDSKSESEASATGPAENAAVAPGLSTKGGRSLGWKHTRPTNHTFTIKRTGRLPWTASTASQSLRAAYVGGVQAEAGAEYAARPTRTGGNEAFRFDNSKQALAADLGQDGVRVNVNSDEARGSATFRLASIGCSGDAGTRLGAARPVSRDGRVSYQRAGVVEWYKNGPLGLEQGFDLAAAPACRANSADQAIELKIEVGHRHHATLMHGKDGSQWLELRDDANKTVMRYSDLFAADADQKLLPTKMSFENDVLTLRVDDRGAKYPLHIDPLIWAQINVRYKSGDINAGDFFGHAVAVSGNHAVVGAPQDDENCTTPADCNSGAAYIFTLDGQGVWQQQVKILGLRPAPVGLQGGQLGYAVAITDIGGGEKRIVLGAPQDPGLSGGSFPEGLAVWFRGRDSSWIPEGQFDGEAEFGTSVGVSGNRVIVGQPGSTGDRGSAVIYEPDPFLSPPWGEAAIINDPANFGRLGTSVGIDGDVAVAGAPECCDSGSPAPNNGQGVAYVYERRPDGTWDKFTGDLIASDGASGDNFGTSVAVQGLSVVVGAPLSHGGDGGAYVYINSVGTWGDEATLHDKVGGLAPAEQFGRSVAIASNMIVVGSIDGDFAGTRGGAAWVFNRTGANWNFHRKLYAVNPVPPHAPQPTDQEWFGASVAIDRDRAHVLIGAPLNSDTQPNSGAFYDFIQRKDLGTPCGAAAECASDLCVDGVCCDSVCGGGNPSDCIACVNTSPGAATLRPGLCGIADTTTVCHRQSDLCDRTVMCDGTSDTCGSAAAPNTTVCRAAVGGCDVQELCDGTSLACPTDAIRPVQFECRGAAGVCDVPELCNGQDKSCPADLLKPSYTICRLPSGGECDSFEVCNGTSIDCPADTQVADNVACSAGSCQAGICRPEADLGITIGGPASVEPNQDLTYTLTVTNYGRSTATNISITVTLEDGATVVSSSGVPATCQSVATGAQCTLASLDPQQSSPISLLVHPPAQQESMRLRATVSAMLTDPNMANNSATLTQNLLSARLSGGGAGCSTVPGGAAGASPFASLLGLLVLASRRRRRAA